MSLVGVGMKFEGFGTKWDVVKSALSALPSDTLVAIIDGRDFLLNIKSKNEIGSKSVVEGFSRMYRLLTLNKPGAVVMSVEGQCCVGAMTYAKPGDYFTPDRKHLKRACASGEEGCTWAGDSLKLPWEEMMQDRAKDIVGHDIQDAYLNAGLVAGRAKDLRHLVSMTDMAKFEDDQAIFSDLMYVFPDLIVLDYAQEMFGNMRWTRGMDGGGCIFHQNESKTTMELLHDESNAMPLFLHTPGKFFSCYDHIADMLELHAPEQVKQQQIGLNSQRLLFDLNAEQKRASIKRDC